MTGWARWRLIGYRMMVLIFVGALGVGVFLTVRSQDWAPVGRLARELDPGRVTVVLIAAMLINSIGLVLGILGWRALFLGIGARVGSWTALRLCFVGFLAKFVPGRFVALPVLLRMGKEIEVGPIRLASVFMMSWGIAAVTACAIGLAAGPGVAGVPMYWLAVAAIPVAVLLWRPDLLARVIALAERLSRRPQSIIDSASGAGVRPAIALQSLSWLVSGHHLWLLAVLAGAPPGPSYLICVAGFPVAATVGILVLVAPDGIGVREAVLMVGLTVILPLPLATAVTLASRLVCTLSEVAIGTGGLALSHHLHRRQARQLTVANSAAG